MRHDCNNLLKGSKTLFWHAQKGENLNHAAIPCSCRCGSLHGVTGGAPCPSGSLRRRNMKPAAESSVVCQRWADAPQRWTSGTLRWRLHPSRRRDCQPPLPLFGYISLFLFSYFPAFVQYYCGFIQKSVYVMLICNKQNDCWRCGFLRDCFHLRFPRDVLGDSGRLRESKPEPQTAAEEITFVLMLH